MTGVVALVLGDSDGWDGHMAWGGGWLMLIWATLMMAGLVVLVVWLIRTTAAGGGGAHGSGAGEDPLVSARRILAERFARGELSPEEYRERLDQLV